MKAEILSLARNCDPHITISKISQISGVIVVEVLEGEEKPYSCSSGYFRRLDAVTQKMTQKDVVKKTGVNADEVRRRYGENAEKIFLAIQGNPFIKAREIADKNQLAQRTVENAVAVLKKSGILKRIGPDKGGHWEII